MPFDTFPGPKFAKRYTAIYGTLFPNIDFTRFDKGNLSYGSDLGTVKEENIITDNLGFRNAKFYSKPDVILVGDSQIACYSVSQENILSQQIMNNTDWKVYNISSVGDPRVLAQIIEDGIIGKPRWVIFEKIEREIPDFRHNMNLRSGKLAEGLKFVATNRYTQYVTDFVSKYTRQHVKQYLRAELFGRTQYPKSVLDSSLFFHDAKRAKISMQKDEVDKLAEEFIKVKDYFERQDIKFAFLPFPNKETIYWEDVPLEEQPNFMSEFIESLKKGNVNVIPSFERLYENRYPKFPYHKDDTHWNEYGIHLVAKEIIDFIHQKEEIYE